MTATAATVEDLERRLARVEDALARLEALRRPVGKTVSEIRRDLEARPKQEWTEETWQDFRAFVGMGEGPPDLAEHFRQYLHGDVV